MNQGLGAELDYFARGGQAGFYGAHANKEKNTLDFENSRWPAQLVPNGFDSAAPRNIELKCCMIKAKLYGI